MINKVSILIPTYRGAHRLERLFKSMLENDLNNDVDYEIIVLDDGSPEIDYKNVENTVANSKLKCTSVSLQHGGWVSTVNKGVSISSGNMILLLDDDVLFPKDLLTVLRRLINSIDNIGVLSWRSLGIKPGQSTVARPGFIQPATELAGYCMAFKKYVWTFVGGFDPRFKVYCGDSDFCLRVTLAGYPSYRVWWPLVPHEEHKCFDEAPELSRESLSASDLEEFKNKWGALGSTMESRALLKE